MKSLDSTNILQFVKRNSEFVGKFCVKSVATNTAADFSSPCFSLNRDTSPRVNIYDTLFKDKSIYPTGEVVKLSNNQRKKCDIRLLPEQV